MPSRSPPRQTKLLKNQRKTRIDSSFGTFKLSSPLQMATERDPLLFKSTTDTATGKLEQSLNSVGPLEISRSTRYAILAGLWTATFLSALNSTSHSLCRIVLIEHAATLVATLFSSISSEFEKSNEASWLGTSYLLAICTFTPLYGRLCDLLGRRGANQTAVIAAALGTAACGFSRNMEMLILARFVCRLPGFLPYSMVYVISPLVLMRVTQLLSLVRDLEDPSGVLYAIGKNCLFSIRRIVRLSFRRFGWRWAFIMQLPLFALSFSLTAYNLHYVTPGKARNTKDILKRVDWGGSFTLLVAVGAFLVFLSMKFNEDYTWDDPWVIIPLALTCIFFVAFILVEVLVAPEPVLAPSLLKQRVPVLVGASNVLVGLCNFATMYFFPMWFQTVAMTSASVAGKILIFGVSSIIVTIIGLHLLPYSVCMSVGSLFSGWMMHRTGKYKMINLIFGTFPFIGTVLIAFIDKNSGPLQTWFSIVPLGFGNAVVLQTTTTHVHCTESSMAVGTGFGQVFRGIGDLRWLPSLLISLNVFIGQMSGVAVSSALFQSKLNAELHARIHTPDADEIITRIRRSMTLIARLPPDLQRAARDSYAVSLRAVFFLAACSTLLAYIARLPIPEKTLEHNERKNMTSDASEIEARTTPSARAVHSDDNEAEEEGNGLVDGAQPAQQS
ncbi:vacuolar amino acid permease [Chiua virens]|nr:vacuolar amino acid permease [Chiua virens]